MGDSHRKMPNFFCLQHENLIWELKQTSSNAELQLKTFIGGKNDSTAVKMKAYSKIAVSVLIMCASGLSLAGQCLCELWHWRVRGLSVWKSQRDFAWCSKNVSGWQPDSVSHSAKLWHLSVHKKKKKNSVQLQNTNKRKMRVWEDL